MASPRKASSATGLEYLPPVLLIVLALVSASNAQATCDPAAFTLMNGRVMSSATAIQSLTCNTGYSLVRGTMSNNDVPLCQPGMGGIFRWEKHGLACTACQFTSVMGQTINATTGQVTCPFGMTTITTGGKGIAVCPSKVDNGVTPKWGPVSCQACNQIAPAALMSARIATVDYSTGVVTCIPHHSRNDSASKVTCAATATGPQLWSTSSAGCVACSSNLTDLQAAKVAMITSSGVVTCRTGSSLNDTSSATAVCPGNFSSTPNWDMSNVSCVDCDLPMTPEAAEMTVATTGQVSCANGTTVVRPSAATLATCNSSFTGGKPEWDISEFSCEACTFDMATTFIHNITSDGTIYCQEGHAKVHASPDTKANCPKEGTMVQRWSLNGVQCSACMVPTSASNVKTINPSGSVECNAGYSLVKSTASIVSSCPETSTQASVNWDLNGLQCQACSIPTSSSSSISMIAPNGDITCADGHTRVHATDTMTKATCPTTLSPASTVPSWNLNGVQCISCSTPSGASNVMSINSAGMVQCASGHSRITTATGTVATCATSATTQQDWNLQGITCTACTNANFAMKNIQTVSPTNSRATCVPGYSVDTSKRTASCPVTNLMVAPAWDVTAVTCTACTFTKPPTGATIDAVSTTGQLSCVPGRMVVYTSKNLASCPSTYSSGSPSWNLMGLACEECTQPTSAGIRVIDDNGNVNCSDGYSRVSLVATTKATCTGTAMSVNTWNLNGIQCQECLDPNPATTNIQMIVAGTVTCVTNYVVHPAGSEASCPASTVGTSASVWDVSSLSCKALCTKPATPSNGNAWIQTSGTAAQTISMEMRYESLDFSCQSNHQPTFSNGSAYTSSAIKCAVVSGSLAFPNVQCTACNAVVSDGVVMTDGTVTCSAGFTYVRPMSHTPLCNSTGSYTNLGTCDECTIPTSSAGNNVDMIAPDGTITCDEGHTRTKSGLATCQSTATAAQDWQFSARCLACTKPTGHNINMINPNGTVVCDDGFTDTGTAVATCLASTSNALAQTWDVGTMPRCKALCPKPTEPANALNFTAEGTQAGTALHASLRLICQMHYRRLYVDNTTAPEVVQCSVTLGTAAFRTRMCRACAGNVMNGQVLVDGTVICIAGYTYVTQSSSGTSTGCTDQGSHTNLGTCDPCTVPTGANINKISATGVVTCNTGYTNTKSSVAATCPGKSSGTATAWTGADTHCQALCTKPTQPTNANTLGGTPVHNNLYATLTFSCATNYKKQSGGSPYTGDSITCTVSAGTASFPTVTCAACSKTITNGMVSTDSTVTCSAGYTHVPSSTPPSCDATATWLNVGNCQECDVPMDQNISMISATGAVTCLAGFSNTKPRNTAMCAASTTDGNLDWTNADDHCKECRIPTNQNIQTINFDGTFICDTGYTDTGNGVATCLQQTTQNQAMAPFWGNANDRCKALCAKPTQPTNANTLGGTPVQNNLYATLTFSCATNYRKWSIHWPYPSDSITCRVSAGTARFPPVTCSACRGSVQFGTVGIDGGVTCNAGYTYVAPGSFAPICSASATYTNLRTCERCRLTGSNVESIGTDGTVNCRAGFTRTRATSTTKASCPAQTIGATAAMWNLNSITCPPCAVPSNVNINTIASDGVVTCSQGHTRVKNTAGTCNSDSQGSTANEWAGVSSHCTGCQTHTDRNVKSISDAGSVTCNDGYTNTLPSATAICSPTSPVDSANFWNYAAATCQSLCSKPAQPANSNQWTNTAVYNNLYDTLNFACSLNYRRKHNDMAKTPYRLSTVTCTVANGQASFPDVICEACTANVTNGRISLDGTVTCDAGSYYRSLNQMRTCTDNAEWTNYGNCTKCLVPANRHFHSIAGNGSVTCDTGYTLRKGAAASSTCTVADPYWQVTDTTCVESCSVSRSRMLVQTKTRKTLTLTCNCQDDHTAPVYSWHTDATYAANSTTMDRASGDLIINIMTTSIGAYTCVAKNNRGNFTLKPVNIEVYVAPTIVYSSNNVTNATNVTIECISDARPAVTEQFWTFANGTRINNASRFTVSSLSAPVLQATTGQSTVLTSLTIRDVTTADRMDSFFCFSHNGINIEQGSIDYLGQSRYTASTTIQLNVQTAAFFVVQPVLTRIFPHGSDIILTAEARGNPLPTSSWQSPSRTATSNDTFFPMNHTTISLVRVPSATFADAGSYQCVFTNSLTSVTSISSIVEVVAAPTNTYISPSVNDRERESVKLECTFRGQPMPAISWLTSSGEEVTASDPRINVTSYSYNNTVNGFVYTESNLTIANITRDDMMAYYCTGANGIATTESEINRNSVNQEQSSYSATATVSLNVMYASTFVVMPEAHYPVDNQSNTSVSCSASGNPAPTANWTWVQVTSGAEEVVTSTQVSGFTTVTTLTIMNANEDLHSGNYTCQFFNPFGSVSATTTVDVKYIDECLSRPCARGTCESGIGSYTCTCPSGYVGTRCETSLDDFNECLSTPCLNNATCADGLNSFSCICAPGYTGTLCGSLLDCPQYERRDSGGVLCESCKCNRLGASGCDMNNGTCFCNDRRHGDQCDQCQNGYFQIHGSVSECAECPCVASRTDTTMAQCDQKTGRCNCMPQYTGDQCQLCSPGHFQSGSGCSPCACDAIGSVGTACHVVTGQCICHSGSTGRDCAKCDEGFFQPNAAYSFCVTPTRTSGCQECSCSAVGANGTSCAEGTGACECLPGYTGLKCDECENGQQFYGSNGCTNISTIMFTPNNQTVAVTISSTYTLNNYSLIFGSSFNSYSTVTISKHGYMSLSGFSGSYASNTAVTAATAIVAPFWTSPLGQAPCKTGTVTTYRVTNQSDPVTFTSIVEAVQAQGTFEPTEALVTTWREIGENRSHAEVNTFQAVIVGDACQSYAIFNYPSGGIGWFGDPVAVIAAGTPRQYSNNAQLLSNFANEYNGQRKVYSLTPGCNRRLQAAVQCQANVKSATTYSGTTVTCPANSLIVSVLPLFTRFTASVATNCFRTNPVALTDATQHSTICCYDATTTLLVERGPGRPYVSYNINDDTFLRYCHEANMLAHFFTNRQSPLATTSHPPYRQGSTFGDPHFVTLFDESYGFHGIGEYLIAKRNSTDFQIAVYGRAEVRPINTYNFTSFTRLAFIIRFGSGQPLVHFEVFSSTSGALQFTNPNGTFDASTIGQYSGISVINGELHIAAGSVGVNVRPQTHPLLSVAFLIPDSVRPSISGLLNIKANNPTLNLSIATDVYNTALTFQVKEEDKVFSYTAQKNYSHFNPPPLSAMEVVDPAVVNTTGVDVSICNNDTACITDFLATKDDTIARSTRDTDATLKKSSKRASQQPPYLTSTPARMDGTYGVATSVSVNATAFGSATIRSIAVVDSSGFEMDEFNTTYNNETNTLLIKWIPRVRRPTDMKLVVEANDSNADIASLTIQVTLCSCDSGTCLPVMENYGTFKLRGCNCSEGYTGALCDQDYDACASQPCDFHRNCTDEKPPSLSYRCGYCRLGYMNGPVLGTCVNENECTIRNYCAKTISTCLDTLGSYVCPCATGYTGSGNTTCTDINECTSSHNCDSDNAVCTNVPGSYVCSCRRGFNGTGITASGGCFDINQCSVGDNDCLPQSTCRDDTSKAGVHHCTCPDKQLQTRDHTCDIAPTSSTNSDRSLTLRPGETATFTCMFQGLIRNQIIWYTPNNTQITHSRLGYTYTSTRTNTSASTTLRFVVQDSTEGGQFRCWGGNSRDNTSQNFTLSVLQAAGRTPDSTTNIGLIVGAACGGIAFVGLLVAVAVLYKRRSSDSMDLMKTGGRKSEAADLLNRSQDAKERLSNVYTNDVDTSHLASQAV